MAVTLLIRVEDDPTVNLGYVVDVSDGFRQYGSSDLAIHCQVYLPNITRDEVAELLQSYDELGNYIGRKFRTKLARVAEIVTAGRQYTYNGTYSQLKKQFFDQV